MEEKLLDILRGKEVSSITFIRDYVQLQFDDGIIFTLYNYPMITIDGIQYNINDLGYRDFLCSILSKVVMEFEEVLNEYIKMFLSDGVEILVSLQDSSYIGPEVAVLTIRDSFAVTW